ncbi:MAG TPA: iron-containing alcohol dehydrogenase [Bryobacteraceae bacterium]|nr:iron-containing alcohol dehydrogenase [Bryobacteraceae bacterium]
MQNFEYQNPVKILFGRGQIARIASEIPAGARVLITYGGGSIRSNGVYDQVKTALAGWHVAEFGGIEPNPAYETLMRAVEKIRAEKLDFLLAVGGGSVLDGTKFIAAAVPFHGEPWDILAKGAPVESALPIGCVLTLPATGSEMNTFAVISRQGTGDKLAFGSPLVYPRFSVLDPESTFTLPVRQTANGVVDAFAHVLEQYMTYDAAAPLQDRMAEAILLTLIEEGPKVLANPSDYDARANIMWCATMALNGLIAVGVPQDWSTHMIGHEITALHGLDHAQTLAVVFPAALAARRESKRAKLLQFAARVWGIREGDPDTRIDTAIARTRTFFESLGVPTRLSAYGIPADTAQVVAGRFEKRGWTGIGERGDVGPAKVEEILALCV